MDIDFSPCAEQCPAITGLPYGSLRYCPKLEPARHRVTDQIDASVDTRAYPRGEHPIYDHPDYTDCCADFGCCMPIGTGLA